MGLALCLFSALAVAGSAALLLEFGIVAASLAVIATIAIIYGLVLALLPRRKAAVSLKAGTPIRPRDPAAIRHR